MSNLKLIITARVRTYDGRLCFHRCVSVQLSGGGYHVVSLGRGGTPSHVWLGGYPISGPGGYPISGLGEYPIPGPRGYPIPGPGVPHPRSWGVPHPRFGGTPSQVRGEGVPQVPPRTDQHSEHLLRGGRYASCVHAGGLSCLLM